MRKRPLLLLRAQAVMLAAAVAATLTVAAPAQAEQVTGPAPVAAPTEAEAPPAGPYPAELVTVTPSPSGAVEVTQVSTGDSLVIDADLDEVGSAVPAHEHHLVDGCGQDWGRPYCDLTRAAQGLLIVGSLASVAAALCTFGPWTCVIASGAAAAAAWYLVEYGRCPGNLRVRWDVVPPNSFTAWCL